MLIMVLLVVTPLALLGFWSMERKAPVITHDLSEPAIGKTPRQITIEIAERGQGLKSAGALISQEGREVPLDAVQFEGSVLMFGSGIETHQMALTIDPAQIGLTDGEAILRIVASDYSWRNWWNGNQTVVDIPLTIDSKPPSIVVLSRLHYVNQGGCGLVIYRLNESCPRHGVLVGDRFFPGHPAGGGDPAVMLAFFAVGYDQRPDTAVRAQAVDRAGNEALAGFGCRIRPKRFRKDVLNISDRFIEQKVRPLLETSGDTPTEPLDVFLAVNRDMRKSNSETFSALADQTSSAIAWEGTFMRLPKAANRAQFADHRVYKYRGSVVDRQVHLGADLASLQQAPVPAANHGQVVFADNVGIYGNTVVIDHGLGIFSLYSHLSSITVQAGDKVSKGDNIGRTGTTGLAVGDHLHFGMMVHNTLVNPIEWWDAHWIKDNIAKKLELVR